MRYHYTDYCHFIIIIVIVFLLLSLALFFVLTVNFLLGIIDCQSLLCIVTSIIITFNTNVVMMMVDVLSYS